MMLPHTFGCSLSLQYRSPHSPPATFRPIREKPRTVVSTENWYMKRNGPVEVSSSLEIVACNGTECYYAQNVKKGRMQKGRIQKGRMFVSPDSTVYE
eukprot:scaffold77963_cov56-Attheya_sp.AAC.1